MPVRLSLHEQSSIKCFWELFWNFLRLNIASRLQWFFFALLCKLLIRSLESNGIKLEHEISWSKLNLPTSCSIESWIVRTANAIIQSNALSSRSHLSAWKRARALAMTIRTDWMSKCVYVSLIMAENGMRSSDSLTQSAFKSKQILNYLV